jgi:hypothetical protein
MVKGLPRDLWRKLRVPLQALKAGEATWSIAQAPDTSGGRRAALTALRRRGTL